MRCLGFNTFELLFILLSFGLHKATGSYHYVTYICHFVERCFRFGIHDWVLASRTSYSYIAYTLWESLMRRHALMTLWSLPLFVSKGNTCQGELHSVREAWDFKSQENRDDEPCAQSLLLELHDIGDVAVGLVQLCIDSIQEIARCLLVILHLVHLWKPVHPCQCPGLSDLRVGVHDLLPPKSGHALLFTTKK